MIRSKIIADSRNPSGSRLTTFQLTYPRMIHAETLTHRSFSRNAASSRAIPVHKMLDAVASNPATPVYWGSNQSGMQAGEQLAGDELLEAHADWIAASEDAMRNCRVLNDSKLHKQIANRVLEPFSHITVIVTAEEKGLRNFFSLRAHEAAQPEFQVLAYMMLHAWLNAKPVELAWGDWHMPFGNMHPEDMDLTEEQRLKVATGRIARVSYLTHDGLRDAAKDIELHDRLKTSGHWSPFEHCAQAELGVGYSNFGETDWLQYRKMFSNECAAPTNEELRARLDNMPEWAEDVVKQMQFEQAAEAGALWVSA
jgi:thymidylate synthase ThyX